MTTPAVPEQAANGLAKAIRVAGKHIGSIITLPPSIRSLKLSASRDSWPSAGDDTIFCGVDVSYDLGLTWQFLAGFTAAGGSVMDPRTGSPATESFIITDVPEAGNPNRRLRPSINCKVDLMTKVDITPSQDTHVS